MSDHGPYSDFGQRRLLNGPLERVTSDDVAPVVLQTMHREIIAPRKLGNNGAIIPSQLPCRPVPD